MTAKGLIKKLHEHNLILEDVVLLGAALFEGWGHNQVFGGMWDMYQERMTKPFLKIGDSLLSSGRKSETVPDFTEMRANDFAEWLSRFGHDGYLCMIAIPFNEPTHGHHSWQDRFFYGESIDDCVDQAIAASKQQRPVLSVVT